MFACQISSVFSAVSQRKKKGGSIRMANKTKKFDCETKFNDET